jgi:hypothetical protein
VKERPTRGTSGGAETLILKSSYLLSIGSSARKSANTWLTTPAHACTEPSCRRMSDELVDVLNDPLSSDRTARV